MPILNIASFFYVVDIASFILFSFLLSLSNIPISVLKPQQVGVPDFKEYLLI